MAVKIRLLVDGREVSEAEWKRHQREKAKRLRLNSEKPAAPAARIHKWPLVSDLWGVMPNQIDEAKARDRRNGTPMDYVESGPNAGAMVIHSKRQFDNWHKRWKEEGYSRQ